LGYKKEMGFKDAFHPGEKKVSLLFVSVGAFLSVAALVSFIECLVS